VSAPSGTALQAASMPSRPHRAAGGRRSSLPAVRPGTLLRCIESQARFSASFLTVSDSRIQRGLETSLGPSRFFVTV
jgi:hypothetical protein